MSDSAEEQEATARNREIIQGLRETFQVSELSRLTHEIEPAMIFAPTPGPEESE